MARDYRKIVEENIKLHKSEAYFYEIQHPEIFNLLEQRRIQKEVKKIQNDSPRARLCLDLGSGTGNIARHLMSVGFETVACDLSSAMLKQNPTSNKILCESSFLPFKAESFDVIAAYSFLHHVPDLIKTLSEVCRVASGISTLYFDNDRFIRKKSKAKMLREIAQLWAYLIWMSENPRFLRRFIEYVAWGRSKHRRYIQNINFELTDKNPVSAERIAEVLANNAFTVQIWDYGAGSLIKARR